MAVARGRVPRSAGDSVDDSSVTEQRPQRRSARNVIQSGDAGDKKLLRSKSKRSGKSTKVSTGIGEVGDDGIGERVDVGICEGADGGIGERVEGEIEGRVVDKTVTVADVEIVKVGGQLIKGGSGGSPPGKILKFVLFYWSFLLSFYPSRFTQI